MNHPHVLIGGSGAGGGAWGEDDISGGGGGGGGGVSGGEWAGPRVGVVVERDGVQVEGPAVLGAGGHQAAVLGADGHPDVLKNAGNAARDAGNAAALPVLL